jgi:hypothetical protein
MFRETGSPQQRSDFDMVLPKRRNCFLAANPVAVGRTCRVVSSATLSLPIRELGVI